MPKFILSIIFLLSLSHYCLASEPLAVSNTKIIRVVSEVWVGDTNADGSGFYYDLLRFLFEPLGYSIQHRILPMKRGIFEIVSGETADILLVDWAVEHLRHGGQYPMHRIIVASTPMAQEKVVALYPPGSSLTWQQIQDDPSKKVAWVKGYNYHRHLGLERHNITEISNSSQGIKMLHKQYLDCFFDDKTEIDRMLGKAEFENAPLRYEVVMKRHLFPIFNSGNGRALLDLYEQRMATMKASGELYVFYESYGKNYHDIETVEIDPVFSQ